MRIFGITLLLLVALQGCGRKGGLFLPTHQPNVQTNPDQLQQSQKS